MVTEMTAKNACTELSAENLLATSNGHIFSRTLSGKLLRGQASGRILIVEDDPTNLAVQAMLLEKEGFSVLRASSGEEGLGVARREHPDVVLLDVCLPGMDGIEVCRQIKRDPELVDVFVLMLSGYATGVEDRVGGLESGADDYLLKPVSQQELGARIRGLLRLKAAMTALRASEERYRSLVEMLPDALALVDAEGRIIAVNPQAVRLLGLRDAKEATARTVFDLARSVPAEKLRTHMATALERPSLASGDYELTRSDGRAISVELRATPFQNDHQAERTLLVVARDTSERKRLEKQNRALKELGFQLTAAETTEKAAELCLETAQELFGWDAAFVELWDAGGTSAEPLLAYDTLEGKRTRLALDSWPRKSPVAIGLLREKGAQLILRGENCSESVALLSFGDKSRVSASLMFVAIYFGTKPIGTLSIQSYRPNAYQKSELELLQTLANYCGSAMARLRSSEELAETEAKYRAIFENATAGICQVTQKGRLVTANPALASMFGYGSPEEMVASVSDVARQTYASPGERDALRAVFDSGEPVKEFECRRVRKDGTLLWVSISGRAFRDRKNAIYYEETCRDITEWKEAQMALSDALELNQTILATSRVGMQAYHHSGACVFANTAAAEIAGQSLEELRRENLRRCGLWQKSGLMPILKRTLRTGQVQAGEFKIRNGLGKTLWLDCHLAPFVSHGEAHILVLSEDITARKSAREALLQAKDQIAVEQERYQRLFDFAPDAYLTTDFRGRIREANHAAAELLRRAGSNLVGKCLLDFMPSKFRPNLNDCLRSLHRQPGERFAGLEFELQGLPNEPAIPVAATLGSAKERNGDIRWLLADITEQRRLERSMLLASEREQRRIGEDMHDGLCQELFSVAMTLNTIGQTLSSARRPESDSVHRLALQLNDINARARAVARGLNLSNVSRTGLSAALQDLAETTSLWRQVRCRFHASKSFDVRQPNMATHLYRIAREAVHNAIKHGRPRRILISLYQRQAKHYLRVRDDGEGFREPEARHPGMGLEIMRYRAEQIGGELKIQPAPGGGTDVTCAFVGPV